MNNEKICYACYKNWHCRGSKSACECSCRNRNGVRTIDEWNKTEGPKKVLDYYYQKRKWYCNRPDEYHHVIIKETELTNYE